MSTYTKRQSKRFMAGITLAAILLAVAWAATLPPMVPDNVDVQALQVAAAKHAQDSLR